MSTDRSSPESTATDTPRRLWLHLVLFTATFVTTTLVGLDQALGRQDRGVVAPGPSIAFWLDGLSYSVSLMAILLAHEMGHYLEARRRGVDASLPYFLPMLSAFGTLGAFIRLRIDRPIPAGHLARIGAYGPLAGFIVTVPVLLIGIGLSDVAPTPDDLGVGVSLGDSLLLRGIEAIVVGDVPAGMDIWLHPMAYAGWAGLFVTALNLLPISQLDGGHLAYCLMGERFNRWAPRIFAGLVAFVLFVYWGWLVLCLLLLFIGVEHPPMCPDVPVTGRARWICVVTLALLILCFIPRPFGGISGLLEALIP